MILFLLAFVAVIVSVFQFFIYFFFLDFQFFFYYFYFLNFFTRLNFSDKINIFLAYWANTAAFNPFRQTIKTVIVFAFVGLGSYRRNFLIANWTKVFCVFLKIRRCFLLLNQTIKILSFSFGNILKFFSLCIPPLR